jgi:hypothetical protein
VVLTPGWEQKMVLDWFEWLDLIDQDYSLQTIAHKENYIAQTTSDELNAIELYTA